MSILDIFFPKKKKTQDEVKDPGCEQKQQKNSGRIDERVKRSAPGKPVSTSSFSRSKRYNAAKIIEGMKANHTFSQNNLMDKGMKILNENINVTNEEEAFSIIEALKLFIEVNKIIDRQKEESGRTSPWKPQVLLNIALCNFKIGNIDYAYAIAKRGLHAVDDAINDSFFMGIPRSHYGEDSLKGLIEVIETSYLTEAQYNGDVLDVDENYIDTQNLYIKASVTTPNNNENVRSKEYLMSVIKKYDALRTKLMVSYFMKGNQQSMSSTIIMHAFMSPVFYAWQYWGHGDMYDFWSEDKSLGIFEKFKSSDVLETTKSQLMTITTTKFPFQAIDQDGSLKAATVKILNALIEDLENESRSFS